MSIFYMDYENGVDATTNTPLGWWSVAYTGGSVLAPIADEVVTGTSSSATAKVSVVVAPTSGSWTAGSATGTMYFYGKSGTFQSELVTCAGGGSFNITSDFTYCAWKTTTLGATLARIAPGDIIRIAKSGSQTEIGEATWTSLSKTVTLATAQILNVDLCNAVWTSASGTSASTPVATDAKEGSWCQKVTESAAPAANDMQAYHATGSLVLSSYQKISFWIKNEVAILANQWEINLCSDTSGSVPIDTFSIPAIPSTARWLPLTLARDSGGNLGSSTINSINISNGTSFPTASKYIYIDDIIACTTNGLNLQSLISKNNAEQGGTEGWYGIQSIDGVTVLLDTETNTKSNAGGGYSTSGTTPETVPTYKRETIKTAIVATSTTTVQEIMDSGTSGNNIQFQGGYDTSTSLQTGETFFDGLNGNGYGIYLNSKNFITLNYLDMYRYNYGVHFNNANNNTITTITNVNNNSTYGIIFTVSNNNIITMMTNVNNNSSGGIFFSNSSHNIITTITNANNNSANGGVYFGGSNNNVVTTITNANNNSAYGVFFLNSSNNTINSISTSNNATASIGGTGYNYIDTAILSESIKFSTTNYYDGKVFIQSIGGFANIWCNAGNIVSQNATAGGTGIEWKVNITNVIRDITYPLKFKLAEIACGANTEVTTTVYFKKSHASDIVGELVLPGNQPGGPVTNTTITCASNTNRNLLTLNFTPTSAGVFVVEAWTYWAANLADENVIIDDITVSQV